MNADEDSALRRDRQRPVVLELEDVAWFASLLEDPGSHCCLVGSGVVEGGREGHAAAVPQRATSLERGQFRLLPSHNRLLDGSTRTLASPKSGRGGHESPGVVGGTPQHFAAEGSRPRRRRLPLALRTSLGPAHKQKER